MKDLFDLSGRVAAVTGASAGIGRAIAVALASAGAAVILVARRRELLSEAVCSIKDENGKAAAVTRDLGAVENWGEVAEEVRSHFGSPDILVNSAGMHPRQPAATIAAHAWNRTLHLNLSVPFFLAQALVPAMQAKGWGRVINIASLQSVRAMPNGVAYGASKGGVAQLTRAMAEEWSRHGIMCNAIAPGYFPTELTAPVVENTNEWSRLAAQTAIGRNGNLEDLYGPAIFLASAASNYVTGQLLFVDGGFSAK